jgi:hypothetical protein
LTQFLLDEKTLRELANQQIFPLLRSLVMENLVEEKNRLLLLFNVIPKAYNMVKRFIGVRQIAKRISLENSRIFRSVFSLREARKINLVIAPLARIVRRQINVFSQNYAV